MYDFVSLTLGLLQLCYQLHDRNFADLYRRQKAVFHACNQLNQTSNMLTLACLILLLSCTNASETNPPASDTPVLNPQLIAMREAAKRRYQEHLQKEQEIQKQKEEETARQLNRELEALDRLETERLSCHNTHNTQMGDAQTQEDLDRAIAEALSAQEFEYAQTQNALNNGEEMYDGLGDGRNRMETMVDPAYLQSTKQPNKSRIWLIVGLFWLVLLIIVVIIKLMNCKREGNPVKVKTPEDDIIGDKCISVQVKSTKTVQ